MLREEPLVWLDYATRSIRIAPIIEAVQEAIAGIVSTRALAETAQGAFRAIDVGMKEGC